MKKVVSGCVILLFAFATVAQQSERSANKWTLQACIDYAHAHNLEIQMRQVNIDKQEVVSNTAQNRRLPNLTAGASQSFSFGRTASGFDNTYQNQNTSATQWSASTSIPIFTGFSIRNEIAATQLELLTITAELENAKENLEMNITSMYLQILYYKEMLGIANRQAELSREQLERTKLLFESERASEAQIYETEAQIASDDMAVVQAASDLQMAILTLTQALELPTPEGFDVIEPEGATDFILVSRPDAIYQTALTSRALIRVEELRFKSSEKYIKMAESSFYPTLSFGAGYGNNYYNSSGFDYPSFSRQLKNNRNEYFGLNLSVPVFNRYSTRNNVKTARLNMQLQALQLENTKKTLYKEIQQAYYNALTSGEKFRAAEVAYRSAEKAFGYMKEKLDVERATMYEYNESKTSMTRALSNRVQAKYDFILRKKILEFYERQ